MYSTHSFAIEMELLGEVQERYLLAVINRPVTPNTRQIGNSIVFEGSPFREFILILDELTQATEIIEQGKDPLAIETRVVRWNRKY